MKKTMKTYTALEYSFPATEKRSHKAGVLSLSTRIHLRGNPARGPIPVKVTHEFHFSYSDPWLDDDGNEINAVSRAFGTYEERNTYCKRFFDSSADWDAVDRRQNA